ncbi:MAG: hypothetical protein ACYC0C_11055 [Devosia sp.]
MAILGREHLRDLANAKVNDAVLLFEHGRYSNSYYLFGYGVELGLKSRIARVFAAETIPDRKFVNEIFSHDLAMLVGLSGLKPALDAETAKSDYFAAHWATVADWSVETRYEAIDEFRATAMRNAMLHAEFGVYKWLQSNW